MKATLSLLLLVALLTGSCKDDDGPMYGKIKVFVRPELILGQPRTLFRLGVFAIESYSMEVDEALYVKPIDVDGATFDEVLPGNYRVVIISGGYSKAVQVKAGQTVDVTFAQ